MSARLGPGVAVLVIGPTVTGCTLAAGHIGTVDRRIDRDQALPEWVGGESAAGDGWIVTFDRPVAWMCPFSNSGSGIFPASSLMPLDGDQAEPEAVPVTVDQPQPVEA